MTKVPSALKHLRRKMVDRWSALKNEQIKNERKWTHLRACVCVDVVYPLTAALVESRPAEIANKLGKLVRKLKKIA